MENVKWFGIKSLYRWIAIGRPRVVDAAYDATTTLVEERVIVISAKNGAEALVKGEKEARKYCKDVHINPYGQRVRTVQIGGVYASDIDNAPRDMEELFSSTHIVGKDVSDREIVMVHMGRFKPGTDRSQRKKFQLREFAGVVKKKKR